MFKRKNHTNPNGVVVNTTLNQPNRQPSIPEKAQWLAGEGAGSWFFIEHNGSEFQITRYSPEGDIECQSLFSTETEFDINQDFEFIHLCHCKQVNLIQNKTKHTFHKTG